MFMKQWSRMPHAARVPKRPLPCVLCGFCAKTDTQAHGYVCLWYDVYQSEDDAKSSHGDLRAACVRDGNFFRFRLENIRPHEMLQWQVLHTDWSVTRRYAMIGAITGVVSLVIAVAALFVY